MLNKPEQIPFACWLVDNLMIAEKNILEPIKSGMFDHYNS